jgi:hypothetical protein
MEFFRSALPSATLVIGLLATAAWMGILGHAVFQMTKWGIIELAELLL